MQRNKFIILLSVFITTFTLTGCNDWLDELPDNRTEIDTKEKIKDLLVSAYSVASHVAMAELMSDNVTDNGVRYSYAYNIQPESYKWQDISDEIQDSPNYVWNYHYKAIAAANYALYYIKELDAEEEMSAQKGEALLSRAYHHFILVNLFSQHYNTDTSDRDMGIPYAEKPEQTVSPSYSRGTVKEVYEKINRDLEEGLPLIDDNSYASNVVKYHFNQKASYAFAARFNLYYGDYDKAIEYATRAIGVDPTPVLRDYTLYTSLTDLEDIGSQYVKAALDCNLLLVPKMSYWPYYHWPYDMAFRYSQNSVINNEIVAATGPWGGRSNFYPATKTLFSNQTYFYPKFRIFFEINDVVAKTGYPHFVELAFTTDETLLTRAEAHIMNRKYDKAATDLAYWYNSHVINPTQALTEDYIVSFFRDRAADRLKPELNPDFEIEGDKQLAFLHCLLYFRRCETIHEGLRWFDIKRFGIEVTHSTAEGDELILGVKDLRRAIQLPAAVISAGIPANPR